LIALFLAQKIPTEQPGSREAESEPATVTTS